MKRFIFFILMFLAIGASAWLLIIGIPGVLDAPVATSIDFFKGVYEQVSTGSWPWGTINSSIIFAYGYFLYVLINAILVLSLLVMALTTLFRFKRVYRFYSIIWWYLFAALVFTGVNVYMMIDGGGNIAEVFQALPWQFYLPIGSAVVLAILGIIFKVTERKK